MSCVTKTVQSKHSVIVLVSKSVRVTFKIFFVKLLIYEEENYFVLKCLRVLINLVFNRIKLELGLAVRGAEK